MFIPERSLLKTKFLPLSPNFPLQQTNSASLSFFLAKTPKKTPFCPPCRSLKYLLCPPAAPAPLSPCSPSSSVPLDRHLKPFGLLKNSSPIILFGCPRNGSFSSAPFFLFFLSNFYWFLKSPAESSTANPRVTRGCLRARHLAKN